MLVIGEAEIRAAGPGNILAIFWRQWVVERRLAARGIRFRQTDPLAVEAAYAAMTDEEFEAINGRQAWANWRTIPRSMSGRVPDRPLEAIDLGCGTGESTRVLAFHCPAASRIVGYEFAQPLVTVASRRRYRHKSGTDARVGFVCQGVTETLRDPAGGPLAAGSVDVANASGVVGHHLTPGTVGGLVAELNRVLAPTGIAQLDVGPTLSEDALTERMSGAGFRKLGRFRSSVFDPYGQVVFGRR